MHVKVRWNNAEEPFDIVGHSQNGDPIIEIPVDMPIRDGAEEYLEEIERESLE